MKSSSNEMLDLSAGELVEVRTEAEILATLDPDGKLESLPFMPEMLKYCGRQFRVQKRAEKTCDTIQSTWRRRMANAVHLDLRCDGSAHDGCQARCLFFWKEAWLKRVDLTQPRPAHQPEATANVTWFPAATSCTRADLIRVCRSTNTGGEPVYMCQNTELLNATSPLAWWQPDQYVRDVRAGNATVGAVVVGTLIGLFNKAQVVLSRRLPGWLLIRGGLKYPFLDGRLRRTPKATLNLEAGDIVEIKSKDEIVATLDTQNRNRGLSFDREMIAFCGQRARVLSRINKIIDERTKKMIDITNDCVILDGVSCPAKFNQFCTRASYLYWREIWLKKVS